MTRPARHLFSSAFFSPHVAAQLAIASVLLLGAAAARAQYNPAIIDRTQRQKSSPLAGLNIAPEMRMRIEGAGVEKEMSPYSRTMTRISEPWKSPSGEPLIAVVGERMLTKSRFTLLVDLAKHGMAPIPDEAQETERRVQLENKVIQDWLEMNSLAYHAEKTGFGVSDGEVNAAIVELGKNPDAAPATGGAGAPNPATPETPEAAAAGGARFIGTVTPMAGIPDAELRIEVRDSLLVDKMVHESAKQYYSDEQRIKLFRSNPSYFIVPESVHAWHLFMPAATGLTSKQQDEALDTMKRWQKQLSKCRTPADIAKMKGEITGRTDIMLSDMGEVTSLTPMPPELMEPTFKTKPGSTTDVIRTNLGMHAIRVESHTAGSAPSFEAAKPAIEAMCYKLMRNAISEYLRNSHVYETSYNATGLVKSRTVARELAPQAGAQNAAAGPGAAAPAVNLSSLNLGGTPTSGSGSGTVKPAARRAAPAPASGALTVRPLLRDPGPVPGGPAGTTESSAGGAAAGAGAAPKATPAPVLPPMPPPSPSLGNAPGLKSSADGRPLFAPPPLDAINRASQARDN